MAELAIHPWDFCFGGLAFLWLAVVAFAFGRQSADKGLWACLAWFGLIHALGLWVQMAAFGQARHPAFQIVRVVLAVGELAALFEFGRRGVRRLGGQTWGPAIYTPLIVLVGAGVLIVSLLSPTAFCVAAGLPAQIAGAVIAILAATGLWRLGHRTPTGRKGLFRHWLTPAAAALLIAAGWVCMHGSAGQTDAGGGRIAHVARDLPAPRSATVEVLVDVQANVQPEEQPSAETRQSLAIRRFRSSLPLMLVSLGFVVVLATMWALAQRSPRW